MAQASTTPLTATALLQQMAKLGASDLHLAVGIEPSFRIDGRIKKPRGVEPLWAERLREFAVEVMTAEQLAQFDAEGDLDFAYSLPGVARFRINALRQRSGPALIVRLIPETVPNGDQLRLPVVCRDLALKPRGLVLITGPTGSGKSTTLAAMLDYINTFEERHILTVEDPVEFVHRSKKSIVTQREIGQDCPTFAQALRRALRQDPDIIMVGELRDLETVSMAITAAETGHLVFATLHTTSAVLTIDRLIDAFPAEAQQQARVQVAGSLQGVISQSLLPRVGGGRIAAFEILIATDGVRSMVRDGKTAQLLNALQTGRGQGMATLEDSLVQLVRDGKVSVEDARAVANRPEEIAKRLATPAPAPPGGGEPVAS